MDEMNFDQRSNVTKVVLLFFILISLYVGLDMIRDKLAILIENLQSWEEYCTENPFECEELI